jgi:hypothetical protein
MNAPLRLFFLIGGCFLLASPLRAQQEEADTDLSKMMKEAQEMQKEAEKLQKENPPVSKKTMAEMQADAQKELKQMEAQEKKEKEAMQAALKKQLAEPGHDSLPGWTPKTPDFTANGSVVKKIVDDEVKIIQTGTSPLSPKELGDSWDAAAEATGKLNRSRNNIKSNDTVTVILFLSTRESPEEKVEMEAKRERDDKVTRIEISSPLPKPEISSED